MDMNELAALFELANRAAKSKAESLWLAALAERLNAAQKQQPPTGAIINETQEIPT